MGKINIHSDGVDLPEFVEAIISRKLRPLLAWHWRKVKSTDVRIETTYVRSNSVRYFCEVEIELPNRGVIRAESFSADINEATAAASQDACNKALDALRGGGFRRISALF